VVREEQKRDSSVIEDIFGGVFNQQFKVGASKLVHSKDDPFFMVNLQFSGEQFLEDCMDRFFLPEDLEDYKVDGQPVKARMRRTISRLPKVLILNVKRFIYRNKVIKMKEEVEFPFVLGISSKWLDGGLANRL